MQDHYSQDDMFRKYLDICNEALAANKNRFPFKQILNAAQQDNINKQIEVSIIDDKPQSSYVIQLADHHISALPHTSCQDCSCHSKWIIPRSYIESVLKKPEIYIQNPAKLNWEWLLPEHEDN